MGRDSLASEDGLKKVTVETKGLKDVLAVEIIDSSGNQIEGATETTLGSIETATETIIANQNPTDKYVFYADETTATYYYYCGEDKDGNWYISRETLSTHVTDFAKGTTDVTTNWTNRASQSYSKFSEVF